VTKRERPASSSSSSSSSSADDAAARKRRSLLFLGKFAGLLVLFALLVSWNPVNDRVVVPFTSVVAKAAGGALNLLSENVTVEGTRIQSPAFAVDVENGCNGLETALLLAAAVLAFPATWKARAIGLLGGFAGIQAINLVRVVSLFWIGRHEPALFSTAHTVIWQSIVVLAGVCLFLLWASRGSGRAEADASEKR
jgi:exosortase H (IPTLxxWG-CTERM-specific)